MENRKEIFKQLTALSVAMGVDQKPERIKFYVDALVKFDLLKTNAAIAKIARTNKFFPQLVEIIDVINGPEVPTDEMAIIIANEILQCAARFSSQDIEGARHCLGDKFQIAERFGWVALTRLEYSDLPATRAQLRELAKAYINRSKREMREGNSVEFKLNTINRDDSSKPGLKLIRFLDE